MMPLRSLQLLLLDLIATQRPVDATRVTVLSQEDWTHILHRARQHRLMPLLHWRLAHEHVALGVPDAVRDALAAAFKQAALRALRLQRTLVCIYQALDNAGIAAIALKGAYLAFNVYPHPALRPLRDLDVLVPVERALQAYQLLLDQGFRCATAQPTNLAACLALKQHLPPLRSAEGNIHVELHTRLHNPGAIQAVSLDMVQLWERRMEARVAGQAVAYLAPTDLLLHLIFHAAYQHKFDNGPLIFSDLAYLISLTQVDWPLFWQLADGRSWTRGCLLLLKMTEYYYGELPIEFPPVSPAELAHIAELIVPCACLALSDFEAHGDISLMSAFSGKPWQVQLALLFRRVFPARAAIAASYSPAHAASLQVYWGYVQKYRRLLTQRLPGLVNYYRTQEHRNDARKIAELDRWLLQKPGMPE